MTPTVAQETHEIRSNARGVLDDKIKKLNKRAKKLGLEQFSYRIHDTRVEKIYLVSYPHQPIVKYTEAEFEAKQDSLSAPGQASGEVIGVEDVTYLEIEFLGSPPVIEGWEFVAVLDRTIANVTRDETDIIVRTAPGQEVPEEFRTRAVCDHCNIDRFRLKTYIVRHTETGEHKSVGSTCVKDFLGHASPLAAVRYFEFIQEFGRMVSESDGELEDPSYGGTYFVSVSAVFAVAAAEIRDKGFVSKRQAEYDPFTKPTAEWVLDHFDHKLPESRRQDLAKIEDQDTELGQKAVEFFDSDAWVAKSDFAHNLKTISRARQISTREFGLATAAISVYRREVERDIERARKAERSNEFLGTIKERRVFENLTVTNVHSFESDFGPVHLYSFEDEAGNSIKWFSSKVQFNRNEDGTLHYWEQGDVVTLKATVKAHEEYKGRNQTIITRAKVQS